jgi:Uma2 family endonuclease
MPVAVTELPARLDPPRKRWTRSEFDALSSSGVLDDQRLELVEGELINKMGKKRPHVNSVVLLERWLEGVFGELFVNTAAPIDVAPEDNPTSEPEPDLIVLKRDLSHFRQENPRPEDLHLVIEVADATLGFDLTTKAALYARAGIADYWVLDVAARRMIVHRDPRGEQYVSIAAYACEERVAPLAAPASELRIGDAFPG